MIKYRFINSQFQATAEDVASINKLLAQLSTKPLEVTAKDLKRQSLRAHIVLALDVSAGENERKIVGMATLTYKDILSGRKGEIDDVVVDEAYRGQDIGTGLMEELKGRARQLKLCNLNLTSKPSRMAAHRLYHSVGFVQRETDCFRLDL